jgi:hypothetical protein
MAAIFSDAGELDEQLAQGSEKPESSAMTSGILVLMLARGFWLVKNARSAALAAVWECGLDCKRSD